MPSFDVIRVEAHRENEALYFHGTTNPVFFKAALTALVTDTDYVSIRNDVATGSGTETEYEFYRIHFTKWRASDNSNFASATEAVDYINDAASVISGEGYIVPAGETLDFELDATGTTILLSNGDDHAVNSIRAIEGADGRVHLQNHNGTSTDYLIRWQDVTIGTVAAGTSLTSVVNALNGLFTQTGGVGTGVVPPFSGIGLSSVTISAPTASGLDIVNPTGPGRWGVQSGATVGDATHYVAAPAGSEIDRNGEYYYFDMYNDAPVIIGLATDRAVLDATPDPYGTKDSMFVWGVEFTTGVNSPTGTRGSSAGRVDGPGWVSWGTSDARDTMVNSASGAASFRVGIASGR
ncbi:MAG: hypothetical protein GY871_19770, partial [Actinomycetales bacterium]|nr:hypothetical protein [Actinomycetales bacterium]